MEIYTTLIKLDRLSSTSIFSQISKGLVDIIQRGVLKPSDRLPSVRKLANALRIHPRTVVAAYEDLEAQRWVETVPRKGIYVSKILPVIKPVKLLPIVPREHLKAFSNERETAYQKSSHAKKPLLIIDDGFPDHRLAPTDFLVREYRRLLKNNAAIRSAAFGEYTGSESLRLTLSKFLRDTRALPISEDNLCVTRGAQMGLYLVCRKFLKKGALVIVGDPNYPFANDVFKECGAKLIPVSVEDDGIDVQKIAQICKKQPPDLIYLIPHHHHPTTVTLSPQKRIALLELIEKYKLMVIEDDYDYDFSYDTSPILPLASYIKGKNIFYLGSISKAISNSLRIGFICAAPAAISEISKLRRLVDLRGDTFFELALNEFIKAGDFSRHLKRVNRIYKERRDTMYNLIQDNFDGAIRVAKPTGGMALWSVFDKSVDLKSLALKAQAAGLFISDGTFYNNSRLNLNSTRMGFASKDESEIEKSIDIMKTILKSTKYKMS